MIVVDPENCGECPYFRQEDGQQYFVFCGREEDREEILQRARELGLSEEDIGVLRKE